MTEIRVKIDLNSSTTNKRLIKFLESKKKNAALNAHVCLDTNNVQCKIIQVTDNVCLMDGFLSLVIYH